MPPKTAMRENGPSTGVESGGGTGSSRGWNPRPVAAVARRNSSSGTSFSPQVARPRWRIIRSLMASPSGLAGHAVDMTGPAGRVLQGERAEGVGEALPHFGGRLVDQDRTDPDPLVGDHAARAALEVVPPLLRGLAGREPLPAFVGSDQG